MQKDKNSPEKKQHYYCHNIIMRKTSYSIPGILPTNSSPVFSAGTIRNDPPGKTKTTNASRRSSGILLNFTLKKPPP